MRTESEIRFLLKGVDYTLDKAKASHVGDDKEGLEVMKELLNWVLENDVKEEALEVIFELQKISGSYVPRTF